MIEKLLKASEGIGNKSLPWTYESFYLSDLILME